jgi:chromosome segregation ATPase
VSNVYGIRQASQAYHRLDQVQRSLEARLASVNEQAQALGARADRAAAALQQQLQETRRTVTTTTQRATTAERRAQQLVSQLDQEYRQQQSALASELGEVKQAASSTGEKVASVAADVNSVRGDVAQTRSELETARTELGSQLKTMKGDLGIQSGLIATNARELAALRELGERHYFEFALAKTGRPYKVANIAMVLRKTDPKRNKFTLDVLADDKKVEKKDKNLNEPVQF